MYPRWLCLFGLLAAAVSLGRIAPARAQTTTDYRIAISDVLIVSVIGEEDLKDLERRVTSSGTISFPFLGEDVMLKDKTLAEAERYVRELLMKDYFVDPQVVVRVKEYRKRSVTVLGEVNLQGVVEFPSEQPMNLLEAIGHAKGFTKLADMRKIIISRGGQKLVFNLKDYQRLPSESKLPQVEPGDVITVEQTVF